MNIRSGLTLLLLLLPAETLLVSLGAGRVALLLVLGPVVAWAYWIVALKVWLSPSYRVTLRSCAAVAAERPLRAFLWLAFVGLFLVSIVRAGVAGSMEPSRAALELAKWGAVVVLMLCAAAEGMKDGDEAPVLRPLVVGLAAHVALNVLLVGIGVHNGMLEAQFISPPEESVMLGILGIPLTRMVLPLGTGTGGIQVAAGIAVGVALWRARSLRDMRGIAIAVLGSSVVAVLATDSRGGMLAATLASASALLPLRALRRVHWLSLLVIAMPALLLFSLAALSNGPFLESVSRPGESSVGILSGRPLIWGTVVAFLLDFQMTTLIGWGAVGQLASGVNARYAFLFEGTYASTASIGAHNAILQSVLEVGYLGTAVLIALSWCALKDCAAGMSVSGRRGDWDRVALALIVCVLLLGMTDATLGANTLVTLLLFMGATLHAIVPHAADVTRARTVATGSE